MPKWRMHTRDAAYKYKKKIQEIANKNDFITMADVKRIVFEFPESNIKPEDETMGWRWSDLKGNKLFVRTLKGCTHWLYICKPTINIEKLTAGPGINVEMTDPEKPKQIFEMNPEGIRIEIPSEEAKDKAFLDYMFEGLKELLIFNRDGRRKCMVWKKSRKKDVVAEEWPCWFHCWSSNRIVKDDGTVVDQLLAVCEHQDGHVERINFDHIRFVEEWD